ncbi:MAG: D-glycero-beta-D-manno-heptose 1,7-bisphosphate 7-phosphatase [Armatimonadota bacterium]
MRVVFLDRDGVLNQNRDDYVKSVDELVIFPEAMEAVAELTRAGFRVVVVSNQAAVARGMLDPSELDRINAKLVSAAAERGGEISAVYCCTHGRNDGCDCRKPEPGMLLRAGRELGFDPAGCWFVGDAKTDMQAGARAGCKTVLVLSGKAIPSDTEEWKDQPEYMAQDLADAVRFILETVRT